MPERANPALSERQYEPIARTKSGSAYVTDDGQDVPSHTLYIYDCPCGHKGGVWYASEARALRSWERHTHV